MAAVRLGGLRGCASFWCRPAPGLPMPPSFAPQAPAGRRQMIRRSSLTAWTASSSTATVRCAPFSHLRLRAPLRAAARPPCTPASCADAGRTPASATRSASQFACKYTPCSNAAPQERATYDAAKPPRLAKRPAGLLSMQTFTPAGPPGVIWRGDSVIDGVPETLDMLRAMVRPGAPSPCLPDC